MAFREDNEEIECEIIESYGIFSRSSRFWNKEVNLISWNGMPAKLDIRNWQTDHAKCGKGIAITREEAEELVILLQKILRAKPGTGKEERRSTGKAQTSGKAASSGKARPIGRSEATKKSGTSREKRPSGKTTASGKQRGRLYQVPALLEPFYKELKLPLGSGPEECKTARNTLLKKYHPDMNTGNVAYATQKTIKIKEAYEKIASWWKAKE